MILWCWSNVGLHRAEQTTPTLLLQPLAGWGGPTLPPSTYHPTLAIKEEGRAGGRSVLGNSRECLAKGPGKVRASGPEQVPSHFRGLRALCLAKERNLLGLLKPEDFSLARAGPSMLWRWLVKPLAGSGEETVS